MLEVKNLSIGYGHKKSDPFIVQKDLSFEICKGEMICLLGPNGCGKSTLLRTLAGLQPAFSGTILINGKDILKMNPKERALLISLVLTDPIEQQGLTVIDLLSLGRNPHTGFMGLLSEKDKAIIALSLEQVQMTAYKEKMLTELSDGERQRIMIAKALVQDTPVIFLDEPTAHLDLPNRVEIMLLLHRLARLTGKTIIISTHELELALQIADRVFLMKKQKGLIIDIPEDLIIKGSLQEVFENSSVRFDPYTGNFKMNHSGRNPVSLLSKGEGYRTIWTEKALIRNGYFIQSDTETVIRVNEKRKEWELDTNDSSEIFNSIGDLLKALADTKEKSL
ncbi:MAG: ABC transporter ATP-binding protein [Bacteroidales bacterium]